MDKRSKLELIKNIKRAAKVASTQSSSGAPDIFEYCQSTDEDVIIACCEAMSKLLDREEINSFKDQLEKAHTCLFNWTSHSADKARQCAFQTLIKLHVFQRNEKFGPDSDALLQKIVVLLLSFEQDQKILIDALPDFSAQWGDHCEEVMEKTLLQFKMVLKAAPQKPSSAFLNNGWNLIQQLSSNDIEYKSSCKLTGVVCSFLENEMSTKLYKDILTGIAPVMDKMSSPLRLADFLTQSFDIGGAVSLMSLQGLFILMHRYNLDYPDFYGKLYSMCQPQIFGARYRSRFFNLADTFLSSTHLPAYLVAAFVKKLARLILHAPTSGVQLVITFILNLIKRHPSCEVLLHRTQGITDMESDPFLENEELSKCQALDSCLWELQTLEHHYDPNVSQKAKKRHVKEEDLAPLLDYSTGEVIESECKKLKKDVPTNFERSTGFELPSPFVF